MVSFTPLCGGAVEEPLIYQGGARTPLAVREPRGREPFFVDPAPYGPAGPAEQSPDGVQADDRFTGRGVS